jgi:hypothetical protein
MFGISIQRTKTVKDREDKITELVNKNDSIVREAYEISMMNHGLKRKNRELTVMLEKTRCRFVPVNDKNMNALEDENFYLTQRVESLKRTLIKQDDYYKNFVVQVALIDV